MPKFLILLLLAIAAYGQQLQQRVAVINTMDDGEPSIKILELTYLTDKLREVAVDVLQKSRYGVMTTESIVAFLGSEERAIKVCKEASCLAELGRMVSANYVAQARIGRFGEDLTIKTELYDTKSGNLIGSFTGDSKNIYGLRDIINEKAPNLFKKLPNVSDDPSTNSAFIAAPPATAFAAAPQQEIESPPPPPPIEPSLETPPAATKEEAQTTKWIKWTQANLFGLQLGFGDGPVDAGGAGFMFGVVRDFVIKEWFYIQPGLMYSKKEYSDKDKNKNSGNDTKYLEHTLLLSLKSFASSPFAIRLNAGPYFGLCIDDGGNDVGNFDFGISLGAGFNILMFYIGAFGENSLAKDYKVWSSGLLVGVNF